MGLPTITQEYVVRGVVPRYLGLDLLKTLLLEFCYKKLYYFFVFGWRCNHASLPVDKFGFTNKDSEILPHPLAKTQAITGT